MNRLIAIYFNEDTNIIDEDYNEVITPNKIKKRATIVNTINADVVNENGEQIIQMTMRISLRIHDYISDTFEYHGYLWRVENFLETGLNIYLDCISEGKL